MQHWQASRNFSGSMRTSPCCTTLEALDQEWLNEAVRLTPDGPVDIGKEASYKTDLQSVAAAPDAAIVNDKPDIRDVCVVGNWAFEWGLFEAGFRPSASAPVQQVQGMLLRVIHRESDGNWNSRGSWRFGSESVGR